MLKAWLGEQASGRWAAGRCGLAVPRQNGKNGVIEIRELYGMVALGERFLHTAHEVKTARKAFLRLVSFFENDKYPELRALVKEIRRTNGQEAIFLQDADGEVSASVEFVARSKSSGRGFTVDVLVLDEAQELTDEQLEALLPTISSSPRRNPQQIMTGTPPKPGSRADVFLRTRGMGVAGTDPRLAWHEWSPPADGPVDVHDRSLWAATNPALGTRLDIATIEDELAAMSDQGFARERLGEFPDPTGSQPWGVIPQAVWTSAGRDDLELLDPVTFALEVTSDLKRAWIAAAGDGGELIEAVELVEELADSERVVPRLVQLHEEQGSRGVVIDERSPAAVFRADLEAAGVPVLTPKSGDVSLAALAITLGTAEGKVLHPTVGELAPVLDRAVGAAEKKSTRESWWIDRRTAAGPFIAASLALWGHRLPVGGRGTSAYEDNDLMTV